MHVRLLIVAASLAFSGCRDKAASPAKASGPVRLFTDEEVASYRQGLASRLDATKARTCPRPVLRGEASPSAPPLTAIDAATGDLGACLDAVKALSKRGKLTELVAARDPELVGLADRCGGDVQGLMQASIQRPDACSPFQIGVGVARDPIRTTTTAYLLGLRARAAAGTDASGIWLMLDTIRFTQDLARGSVSLVEPMVAAASTNTALDTLAALLAQAPPAGDALPPLAAAVDNLLGSVPQIGDALQGETDSIALHTGASLLEAPGWIPPGGWPDGLQPSPVVANPDEPDPRDQGALMLANAAALAAKLATACPSTATLKACHDGLVADAAADDAAAADADPMAAYADLVADALAASNGAELAATVRAKIRTQLMAAMMAVARPAYGQYVARYAASVAGLAALRVHLEVLRVGACPTAAALAAPPFATLLAPAVLGDSLVVRPTADAIELAPPSWATTKRPPWRIACPR